MVVLFLVTFIFFIVPFLLYVVGKQEYRIGWGEIIPMTLVGIIVGFATSVICGEVADTEHDEQVVNAVLEVVSPIIEE